MKNAIILLITILVFTGCNEEDELKTSIIKNDFAELSDLDLWIRENYTTPYNIEVKYKWDDSELENDKILVPPATKNIQPFLETMLSTWIKPYEEEGGKVFIKTYVPKLLSLVGSYNFNNDGTITQGQAESGKKVTIYELNYFDKTDIDRVRRQFHVMHHEFAHILHQTVMYPVEYVKLTPEGYTATWHNFSNEQANEEGFITNYAKLEANEDFVEMIAVMLTNSKEDWEAIINGIKSDEAKTILRVKESYVVNYFSQVWDINIYDLQATINKAILSGAETVE